MTKRKKVVLTLPLEGLKKDEQLVVGGFIEASGVGRQNGYAGFDQYLEVKSVAWPVG